jgi:hypothetical protein
MECLSTEWNFLHTTSELANDDEMRLGNRANAHRLELVTCIMLEIIIVTIPVIRITGIVTIIISNIMQVTSSIKN